MKFYVVPTLPASENISPPAFDALIKSKFQTNTAAAEIMYDTITDMVDLNKDTTLIDLCCGVGKNFDKTTRNMKWTVVSKVYCILQKHVL